MVGFLARSRVRGRTVEIGLRPEAPTVAGDVDRISIE